MTFIQKIKLIIQNMKIDINTIFAYLFISILIFFGGNSFNLFELNYLIFIIIFVTIILLHFILNMFELLGILLKRVHLTDGVLDKNYNDYKYNNYNRQGDSSVGARTYMKKYISIFSNKVKERKVPIPGKVRIKVKSTDDKYVSPWTSVKKKIIKNKDRYDFKIIIFNNCPIMVYYQKK